MSAAFLLAISAGIAFRHVATGTGPVPHDANPATLTAGPASAAASLAPIAAVAESVNPAANETHPGAAVKPTVGEAHRNLAIAALPDLDFPSATADTSIAAPLELPGPPDVSVETATDLTKVVTWEDETFAPPPPPTADPFVKVTVDAEQRPDRGGFLHKVFGNHERPGFTPARPLHEAPPEVPATLRRSLKHDVPVNVRVYLDATGKVHYAELLSDSAGENRDLAALAVFSARHWQFVPAQMGNEAVPVAVVLRFRFGPDLQ